VGDVAAYGARAETDRREANRVDDVGDLISGSDVDAELQRIMAGWGTPARTGRLSPPAPVPVLVCCPAHPDADAAGLVAFGAMLCGGCGSAFTGYPPTVPVFLRWPCCLTCWEHRADLRKRADMPEEGRPKTYPEDYQP
jgi:hypothetical protein